MALGLSTGGEGQYNDVLKYDARSGRFYRVDKVQTSSGWSRDDVEIEVDEFAAIMDLENVETGWVLFTQGAAPQISVAPLGSPRPAKPGPDYKQCFRVMLKLAKSCGGDKPVREFVSSASVVIGAIDKLHNEYEAGVAANPGKLPLVRLEKAKPVKSAQSTNYAPTFVLSGWADRPVDLANADGASAPVVEERQQPAPKAKAAVNADDEF
jgi:hypothetical protein